MQCSGSQHKQSNESIKKSLIEIKFVEGSVNSFFGGINSYSLSVDYLIMRKNVGYNHIF